MDDNGDMNLRNWGFIDPQTTTFKSNLRFQLTTSMADKPLSGDHHNLPPSQVMSSYHQHWMNQNREKFINLMPGNSYYHHQSSYGVSSAHSIPMPQPVTVLKSENVMSEMEEEINGGGAVVVKKRKVSDSTPKEKKPRTTTPQRAPKKRAEIVINGINMDISEIPTPVCSCTGTPQQCYRWGSGGWQSACCTTGLSVYPLPMSTKRRGARIAGRKMSIGAFKKVLEKLTSQGYNFSGAIDLRNHWAKHGTNKFVTIR